MISIIIACAVAISFASMVGLRREIVAWVNDNGRRRISSAIGPIRIRPEWGVRSGRPGHGATVLPIGKCVDRTVAAGAIILALAGIALADPLALVEPTSHQGLTVNRVVRDQGAALETSEGMRGSAGLPAGRYRQVVSYPSDEAPGTIVIDTANTYLYYVVGSGRAVRYGIGVGREGFTWSGVQAVTRKAEWPDWFPPAEMLARQPYLPRVMAGGPGNPLGARAIYLGDTAYRIHGTNQPSTIGGHVSSGCIRMLNDDVIDLYARVNVGTKVIVLPDEPHRALDASATHRQRQASLY